MNRQPANLTRPGAGACKHAYLNVIGTAVPAHEVHDLFVAYAPRLLATDRDLRLFRRMALRSGIERRYSVLGPDGRADRLDDAGLYRDGAFADTAARMAVFEAHAVELAASAVAALGSTIGRGRHADISHLIVVSCTGLYAPGLDLALSERLGLPDSVERTVVGFMGCYAAINALRLARDIVRATPEARVLVVAIELCTLHLQETSDLEQVLSFLLFGDGCAAALVTSEPAGLCLGASKTLLDRTAAGLITWRIGATGFDMRLAGEVPQRLGDVLAAHGPELCPDRPVDETTWAVHPGGRSVLDAVERSLALMPDQLAPSRAILRGYGNMSSATVLFVMEALLQRGVDGPGCAMSFGPGLSLEAIRFTPADA
jgi:alpha-pyrone synthase